MSHEYILSENTWISISLKTYIIHRVMFDLHFPPSSKLCCQIIQLALSENASVGTLLVSRPCFGSEAMVAASSTWHRQWQLPLHIGMAPLQRGNPSLNDLKHSKAPNQRNPNQISQPSLWVHGGLPMVLPMWNPHGKSSAPTSTESSNRRIKGAGKGPWAMRRPKGSTRRAWIGSPWP